MAMPHVKALPCWVINSTRVVLAWPSHILTLSPTLRSSGEARGRENPPHCPGYSGRLHTVPVPQYAHYPLSGPGTHYGDTDHCQTCMVVHSSPLDQWPSKKRLLPQRHLFAGPGKTGVAQSPAAAVSTGCRAGEEWIASFRYPFATPPIPPRSHDPMIPRPTSTRILAMRLPPAPVANHTRLHPASRRIFRRSQDGPIPFSPRRTRQRGST